MTRSRKHIQIVQPGTPPRKTPQNIPLQTALPIHFPCFFLLPAPHYGKKPPRGAHKAISRFLEHTSSHPHPLQENTPVPSECLQHSCSQAQTAPLCALPSFYLFWFKKKKRQKKKIPFTTQCFSDLGSLGKKPQKTSFSKIDSKQNPHTGLELGTDKDLAVSLEEEIKQEEIQLSTCLQSLGKAI